MPTPRPFPADLARRTHGETGGRDPRRVVVLFPGVFHNRPHSAPPVATLPRSEPEASFAGRSASEYTAWLEANIGLVQRLARVTALRARLSASETDEFLSDVHLKLVSDDFAVLRSFRGQSKLTTFLLTVFQRLAFDFRNARWGRWRPSAEAERQGATALRVEELVYRDGLTFDEACGLLHTEGDTTTRDRVYELFVRLPARARPDRFSTDEVRDPIDSRTPEAQAAYTEAAAGGRRLQAALRRICDELDVDDRLALRLRFHGELTVATIARLLQVDEKRLYRRIDQCLTKVRRALEAEGFTSQVALSVVHGLDVGRALPGASRHRNDSLASGTKGA
jgi:RNA polymerase sigma factor (sigma-70 family)